MRKKQQPIIIISVYNPGCIRLVRVQQLGYNILCYHLSRSSLNNRLVELLTEVTGEYFVQMSSSDFEYLLQKISPIIKKQDTHWRDSIPAKIRLAVTLRFLATGDSYTTLHRFFKISSSLVSRIIPEVCQALIVVFKDLIKVSFYVLQQC